MRRTCALCLCALVAGACAKVPQQTALMRVTELQRASRELRATEYALAITVPGEIEAWSLVPFLAKITGPAERDVFGVAGEIGDSVTNIARRLDVYSGYLPKAARWQSELLADELVARDEGQLAISALESVTKLMGRVDALTSRGPSDVGVISPGV